MRGGVSCIFKRYSKTNNEYLKSYDPKQESYILICLDANNLYVYAMSKFHPTGRFKQRDPKKFALHKYSSNSARVFVLEVDLEYPKKLREFHNEYSLAPDKIDIKKTVVRL